MLLTMSCNEDNNDVNRVGRMNNDLSVFMQLKGWAVSERRFSCARLAGSFHWRFLLLTQETFIRVGGMETTSYLEGTSGAMMASAEYRLLIHLLLL